jgi:membrane-bound inhibitor of C-type lysozyme
MGRRRAVGRWMVDSGVGGTGWRGVLAVVLGLTLAGCVQLVVEQPWDPQGLYVCEDGKTFTVELSQDGASAIVTHENRRVALPVTAGATDGKYTDGRTTLYLDGPRALLDVGGQILARGCVKR